MQVAPELRRLLRNMRDEQNKDPNIAKIKEDLRRTEDPRYVYRKNLVYKLMDGEWKIILPNTMLKQLKWACHESLAHTGPYRCYIAMREYFICKNMIRETRTILKICHICQTAKAPNMHTYIKQEEIITHRRAVYYVSIFWGHSHEVIVGYGTW